MIGNLGEIIWPLNISLKFLAKQSCNRVNFLIEPEILILTCEIQILLSESIF